MARARKKPAKAKASKAKPRAQKAKPRAKAKPKAKAKAKLKPKAKVVAKKKPAAVKRPAARTKPKAAARKPKPATVVETSDAVPTLIPIEPSTGGSGRSLTARERAIRSLPVVEILDDPHPIGALRRFLDSVKGEATSQQAQIALGSAQLMLLPIVHEAREHRGGNEVKELVDLVLHHWSDFGDRRKGFHAQEFLRNALAGIGIDRERIAKLEDLVPSNASSELLFNLAGAHAAARDKVAMLRAVARALEAGASASQFRRDPDFAPYVKDPDLNALLSRAEVPPIPVDIEPQLPGVRSALDLLVATLREYGESIELRPPVRLDAILDAERARRISLPNDYRALLTLTNGMALWEHQFFGVGDYRDMTPLAVRAQRYLESMAQAEREGIEDCVPLANWGQPNDWLLYDLRGRLRGDEPGYVLMLNADEHPLGDLAAALHHLEYIARETLGTN